MSLVTRIENKRIFKYNTDYKLANEIRKFVDVLKGSSKLIKNLFNGCWKRLNGLILQFQSRMNYL